MAASSLARWAPWVKWISVAVIVGSLLVVARALPVQSWMQALRDALPEGPLGGVVFGLVYVAATVLFIPGIAITLAVGAVYGLLWGTVIVSLASTTGAALAFLIGRYLARQRVRKWAEARPKFAAIDRAVEEGGWKIVALLRLSPAIPFNLQNYLYGLTAIRFWPCVLTSWIAMLPGTVMYVYFGHLAGLAAGGKRQTTTAEWIAWGFGLAATVAVTLYVTWLARQKLQEQTDIEDTSGEQPDNSRGSDRGWTWGTTAALLLALVAAGAAVYTQLQPDTIDTRLD